ncbi:TetR/AcrR family transcriptional regulator [Paenibacillus sp. ACRRX]|uniref:TetR/AcrR family transcriptional regulator n=1 Tax=Paenibacillus sp. ACRRX TaxID=2918206 RepID=UPI001EF64CA3|nr:TetR/AcrR family transcriptional regulator [Paenibacillus sp. ACRRX]MCG7410713.1 TetR/AcrR family transcriptional regulator [Paenibacillus sp. ACRRX]
MNSKRPRRPGRPRLDDHGTPLQTVIVQTAARMFMEQGFEAISLQLIAKACAVTKATIYYYYSNKAELFTAAVVQVLEKGHYFTQQHLLAPVSFKEQLQAIAVSKMQQSHVDMETMMREAEAQLSTEQMEQIRQAEQHIHDLLAEYFEISIGQGIIRAGNAMMMAHAFSALVMLGNRDSAVQLYASKQQLAEAVVDMFWSGISIPTNG